MAMLICTTTGRTLGPGDSLRVLTPDGFTEGVLDAVMLTGALRVRAGSAMHEIALDDVEVVWCLAG
jgi:hypothetical protein